MLFLMMMMPINLDLLSHLEPLLTVYQNDSQQPDNLCGPYCVSLLLKAYGALSVTAVEVAIAASSARTLAINSGLAITNRMFELMGARSVANTYGFDRYWRDLRTLSLHHPSDYTLQDIGNWVLNGENPMPSPYA